MTHKVCEHENTGYERWKCRAAKRHAGCAHKQNVSQWASCEKTARDETKEN
ncbi:hypothetical protein ACFXPJ_04815 [Streptomyces goshikiensis]